MEEKLVELLRELENAVMAFSRAATIEGCQEQIERIYEARLAVVEHAQEQLKEATKEAFSKGAAVGSAMRAAPKHLA